MSAALAHLLREVGRLTHDEDDELTGAELWSLGETLETLEALELAEAGS